MSNDNTDPTKGGAKFDGEKARMDLLPWEEITVVARVLTFGAKKYGEHNWTEVNRIGRYTAAGFRHMAAFQAGEDADPDSGLHHLAHAATNMFMAMWLQKHYPERDDRFKQPLQKVKEFDVIGAAIDLGQAIERHHQYSSLDSSKEVEVS